jgi:hypothetical protein
MKIRVQQLAGWCAATLLLSACAANGHRDSKPDQPEAVEAVAAQAGQTEPDIIREPTDEEVMYRVFAAEYLGSEGNLEDAVGEYLEAAMRSQDPEIARRATRVASQMAPCRVARHSFGPAKPHSSRLAWYHLGRQRSDLASVNRP